MFLQALSSRDNHKNVATERVNTSINNHEYRKLKARLPLTVDKAALFGIFRGLFALGLRLSASGVN